MQLEQVKIGIAFYRDSSLFITERLYNFFSRIALATNLDKQAVLKDNYYVSYLPLLVKPVHRNLAFA